MSFRAGKTPNDVFRERPSMVHSTMPQLHAACESNNGSVREHNEDNFCCAAEPEGYLFAAVADGVGGHSGGDIASFLCCHRLLLDWKALTRNNQVLPDTVMPRFLVDSIRGANADIFRANFEQHKRIPMCTTIAAVVFTPQLVIAAHVGDSRLYCSRKNTIMQLTIDHTLLNELNETGGLSADTVRPAANIISKAVGPQVRVKPEIHTYFRCPTDRYLLCSDGLTSYLTDNEITQILDRSVTPREATDVLIRETLRRGAADNVTVLCIFPRI